jgi:hypothetical protein
VRGAPIFVPSAFCIHNHLSHLLLAGMKITSYNHPALALSCARTLGPKAEDIVLG